MLKLEICMTCYPAFVLQVTTGFKKYGVASKMYESSYRETYFKMLLFLGSCTGKGLYICVLLLSNKS
jgi:hypothetical protein